MKKISIIALAIIIAISISACAQQKNKNIKNEIIVYGDYKCPYCKKLEKKVMPKIKKKYIQTGKAKFTFINMSFLGTDSIKGSRAGHAVKNIAPKNYLEFQKRIFKRQPNNEQHWITNKLLDREINSLNISHYKKKKIINDYKTKNSKSWKDAINDKKRAKKNKIKGVPTVFVNNKEIDDPFALKEYEKYIK